MGPLLFSLALFDYLSTYSPPDGLLNQLWYLDDGALVGSHTTLASFLDALQHACMDASFNTHHENVSVKGICICYYPYIVHYPYIV